MPLAKTCLLRLPRPAVLAIAAFLAAQHGHTQSIDDLFSDPEQAIIEEEPAAQAETVNLDALVGRPSTSFGGTVNLEGGLGLYLINWPGESAVPPDDILDVLSYTVGYALTTTAYVDARPNGYTRFYASVTAGLDPATLALSGPSLGEMFVDYTYDEKISFRAGKFTVSWGSAGMAASPADIVARAGGGTSLRAFMPVGSHGLTFLSYARADLGGVSPRNLSYAALLDSTFGSYVNSLSAHYRYSEDLVTVWTGRRSFGLLSVGAIVRAEWDLTSAWEGTPKAPALSGLVNFTHEIGTAPIWRFGAEYYGSGSDPDNVAHILSAGLAISNWLPNAWRPGLVWKHSLLDRSGVAEIGFEGPFVPGFRGTIGFTARYGARGTYYRPSSSNALGFGLKLAMEFSY